MGLADTVQYTLRKKDMQKASELFDIDMATLERLNSQRLLNATYIRNILMRADYERLTSGLHWLEHQDKDYRFPEVMAALCREYNVSKKNLMKVLHGRNDAILFCNKCGVRITKACYKRTDGLCPNCFADNIEL